MEIEYKTNTKISPEQFVNVLKNSSLAERRPIDDAECISSMLKNANLLVSAWVGAQLVGVARSVTDFSYCCYLSDLAVDVEYQKMGIGQGLIETTQKSLGPNCKIILLSAPAAVEYYPHIGFEHHPQAWLLPSSKQVGKKP
jgi:ribosomal protein S18 acetylase RimI-like enzyme